jgi:hypothetical protein
MKLAVTVASIALAAVALTAFLSSASPKNVAEAQSNTFMSTVQNVNTGAEGNSYSGVFTLGTKASKGIFFAGDLKGNMLVPKELEVAVKNDSAEVLVLKMTNVHTNVSNDIAIPNQSSVVVAYSNVEKIELTNTGLKSTSGSFIITIK